MSRLLPSKAVKAERFSERSLFERTKDLRAWAPVARLDAELQKLLAPAEVEIIHRRMTRAVYFIELVKSDVPSTKYDGRWAPRFPSDDPRKASFEDCCAIHEAVCREFLAPLPKTDFQEDLKLVAAWGLSPHEFPLDHGSKESVPLHSVKHSQLLREAGYLRLLKIG